MFLVAIPAGRKKRSLRDEEQRFDQCGVSSRTQESLRESLPYIYNGTPFFTPTNNGGQTRHRRSASTKSRQGKIFRDTQANAFRITNEAASSGHRTRSSREGPPRGTKQGRPHTGRRFRASCPTEPSATVPRRHFARATFAALRRRRRKKRTEGRSSLLRCDKSCRETRHPFPKNHDGNRRFRTTARRIRKPALRSDRIRCGILSSTASERYTNRSCAAFRRHRATNCGFRFSGTAPTARTKTGRDGPKPSLPV